MKISKEYISILKIKMTTDKENWSLVQQEVMSSASLLMEKRNLSDSKYKNITVAVQFIKKRKKQTNSDVNKAKAK